jgi:hypothetical protein
MCGTAVCCVGTGIFFFFKMSIYGHLVLIRYTFTLPGAEVYTARTIFVTPCYTWLSRCPEAGSCVDSLWALQSDPECSRDRESRNGVCVCVCVCVCVLDGVCVCVCDGVCGGGGGEGVCGWLRVGWLGGEWRGGGLSRPIEAASRRQHCGGSQIVRSCGKRRTSFAWMRLP